MIDFDPILMGGFFALFIFLLVFLNVTLFKPILNHIDARKDRLQKDQGGADEDGAEAARLLAQAQEVVLSAKQEAHRIKEEALTKAKLKAEERLNAEREKIAKELSKFEIALKTDEANLNSALLGEAPLFKERIKSKFIAA
ncbi:MAG: hypothetical protein LBP89_01565 [Helicobacteraceae bacterium]|jgi:F-type H+-transporting ATPase subunit b|nr:hypothetical protein [Helicobacteraceae bacterium]